MAYNKSVTRISSTGGIWSFPTSKGSDDETRSETGTCQHKVNSINRTSSMLLIWTTNHQRKVIKDIVCSAVLFEWQQGGCRGCEGPIRCVSTLSTSPGSQEKASQVPYSRTGFVSQTTRLPSPRRTVVLLTPPLGFI